MIKNKMVYYNIWKTTINKWPENIEIYDFSHNKNMIKKYDCILILIVNKKIFLVLEKTNKLEYKEIIKFKTSKFLFYQYLKKYYKKKYILYYNFIYWKYYTEISNFFFYTIEKPNKMKKISTIN